MYIGILNSSSHEGVMVRYVWGACKICIVDKQTCKVLKLLEDVNGLYMFEKVGRKIIVIKESCEEIHTSGKHPRK